MAKQPLPPVDHKSYLRRVGSSLKFAAIETFNEKFPIYNAYREDNPEDELKIARKDLKAKRFFNYIKDVTGMNVVFKDASDMWRNAKTSLRSGKFYDARRAKRGEKEFEKSLGFDFSELEELENFDPDKEFGGEEDSSLGDLDNLSSLEEDLEAGLADNAEQISGTMIEGSEYVAGTIKGAASLSYAQSIKNLQVMSSGFTNLSNSLAAINSFNKEQIQTHIENSTQYFQSTTKLLEEQNAMLKGMYEMQKNLYDQARAASQESSTGDKYHDIISPDGRINFGLFKKNFESNLENGPFAMYAMMYNMMKNEIVQNPIQFLMKQMISSLGGEKVEKALENLQKTLVNSLSTLNAKLISGEHFGGGILSDILSLFGIHEDHHTIVKNEFEKGPMQFNGAANKAITEVIPMYLARIEAALTGGPIKLFDMDKGTWTTTKQLRSQFEKAQKTAGGNVDEIVYDNFRRMSDSGKFYFSDEEKKEMQRLVAKEIIPHLKKSHAVIDRNDIIDDGEVSDEFLSSVGLSGKKISPKVKRMIAEVFNNMPELELTALPGAARDDRTAKSDLIASISDNKYSVMRSLFNGSLNGTVDSKYHVNENSTVKRSTPMGDMLSLNNTMDRGIEILKAIYNELYTYHSAMLSAGGGGGRDAGNLIESSDLFDISSNEREKYNQAMWWLKKHKGSTLEDFMNKQREKYAKWSEKDENTGKSFDFFLTKKYEDAIEEYSEKRAKEELKDGTTESLFIADITNGDPDKIDEIKALKIDNPQEYDKLFKKWNKKWGKRRSLDYRKDFEKEQSEATDKYIQKNIGDVRRIGRKYGKIDFDSMFNQWNEDYENATDYDRANTDLEQDIFRDSNISIDPATYQSVFKDFFELVKEKKLSQISVLDGAINKFYNAAKKLPSNFETGNTYLDKLVAQCSEGMYPKDIFSSSNKVFVEAYKAIERHFKNQEEQKKDKKYKDYSSDELSEAVQKVLNEDYELEDYDKAYKEYKGDGFFDKISKASGLDKIGVVWSKLKSLIGKPLDWGISKFNKGTSILGRVLSGDLGAVGDLIPSLDGMAYGGPVTKTGLYALSKGETVIPNSDPTIRQRNVKEESDLIDKIKKDLGLSIVGGRALGSTNMPSVMDKIREQFTGVDFSDTEMAKTIKEYLAKVIQNKDVLKHAYKAIDENKPKDLEIALTGITLSDIYLKFANGADYLMGKTKKAGKAVVNWLPDNVKKTLTEVGKYTKWGALAGILSGMVGGPFGLVGGAMIGAATGFIHESDKAKDLLFGPNLGDSIKKFMGGKNGAKYATIGATVGGLVGGPFGVVGGALLGSGYSFLESSDRFQKIMFGEKGIIARIDHFFGEGFANTRKSFVDYFKEAITKPIENAIVPVGTAMQIGLQKTFKLVQKGLQNLVSKDNLGAITNAIFGKYKDNKYFTGALGGAAGGMLMGGPFGAILGGVVGSIAHGTGFDKKLVNIGKLPGKLLTSFTNRLAKKEIESGNGFNWTAAERIQKMREINENDSYTETSQGKLDIALSEASVGELKLAEIKTKIALGRDPEIAKALGEAFKEIFACLVKAKMKGEYIKEIKNLIDKDYKVDIKQIAAVVQKSNLKATEQKMLMDPNGPFISAIDAYRNLVEFDKLYNEKSAEQNTNMWKKNLGGDDEAIEKRLKLVQKEINNHPSESSEVEYTVTDATVEYGEKNYDALTKIKNTLFSAIYKMSHPHQTITLNDDGSIASIEDFDKEENIKTITTFSGDVKTVTTIRVKEDGTIETLGTEYFNKTTNEKLDKNPNETDDTVANTKAEYDAEKQKEEEQARQEKTLDLIEIIAENASEEIADRKESRKKSLFGKAASGFGDILKKLGNLALMPFDMVLGNIPIVGDIWNAFKKGTGALGLKAYKWAGGLFGKFFNGARGLASKATTAAGKFMQNTFGYKTAKNALGSGSAIADMFGDFYKSMFGRGNGKFGKLTWEHLATLPFRAYGNIGKHLGDNWFGRLWRSNDNLARAYKSSKFLGQTLGRGIEYGGKAIATVAKLGGGLLGKIGSGLLKLGLNVIDAMAVEKAMQAAEDSVEPKDEGQALGFMAKMLAGIRTGVLGVIDSLRNVNDSINDQNSPVGEVAGEAAEAAAEAAGAAGGKGGIISKAKGFIKNKGGIKAAIGSLLTRKNLKGAAIGAAIVGAGYLGVKTGLVSEEAVAETAETSANASRVTSFVSAAYNAVCKVASKFLSPAKAEKLAALGSKLVGFITKPKIMAKIGQSIIGKAAGLLVGPAGWGILGAFAIKAFYDGFSGAKEIWKPNPNEEMTTSKKVICGMASAIADFCCLDLVMPIDQIVGFIKTGLGFTPTELNTGGSFEGGILDGKLPTIFNLKEAMKKFDNSIFDINITQKMNENIVKPIKDFMSNFWNKITSKFTEAIDSIVSYAEKISKWWKEFSVKDAITQALQKGKDWLNKLFDFNVTEESKKVIEEDKNALDIPQLDQSDEDAVAKAKSYINTDFNFDFGKTKPKPVATRDKVGILDALKKSGRMKNVPGGDGGFGRRWFFGKGDGGTNNAELIWKYLESKGLGSSAIAGIMGNIQAESGFMPNRVQGSGVQTAPEITVDGKTGYGLCQWTFPTRQQALKDFAASKGKSSSDLETQLDFMLEEVKQRSPGLIKKMGTMSPYDAAMLFHEKYEGSADSPQQAARRGNYANEIAKNQGKGITNPGTYDDGNWGGNSTSGSGGSAASALGIFGQLGQMLENSGLGKLGQALFGSASFFNIFGSGSAFASGKPGGGSGSGNYSFTGGRTGTSRIVNNMRSLIGKIPYYASDGTNCMRTCGIALKGTPYEGMINVDVAKEKASQLGQLHTPGDGYTPRGADMCIVNNGNHMVMLTETGGTIQNGASRNGVYEVATSPQEMFGKVDYYISSSQYDSIESGAESSVVDFLTKSLVGNVTGKYGESRDGGAHGGIDIGAKLGTEIKSPISGEVSKIAYEPGGYGQYLQIKDNKGNYHLFAHLDKAPKLEVGSKVKAGDSIALVGSSGLSTGPHLHYQIDPAANKEGLKAGPHIDPNTYSISDDLKNRINQNNQIGETNVADFKKLQENSGDGGFLDTLKQGIVGGVSEGSVDYTAKFDVIINLLTIIANAVSGGVMNSGNNMPTNAMIPIMAGNANGKMNTTTPGQSIMNIVKSMLDIASR